jgi:ABC-2 type transport system permease protein
MGIGQVLTMPIFFASTHVNPLTYQVDILRALMLVQGTSEYGFLLDFGVSLMVTAVLTSVAAKMYGRIGH